MSSPIIVPSWFRRRLALLTALKFAPKTLDLHYFALQAEAEKDLTIAVARAAKECDEFPSPRMLKAFITEHQTRERERTDAARLEPDRERIIPAQSFTLPDGTIITASREWKYYCDKCHDSGRLSVWCGHASSPRDWVERRTCERKYTHDDHEYEIFCKCGATNPDVPAWVKARRLADDGEQ